MATGVKAGAVLDKGGNQIFIAQMVASGTTYVLATLTVDTYLFNLGLLQSSDVGQSTAKSDFQSEDGDIVTSSYTYTRFTSGVLMQNDGDLIDLLADTVKGKVYFEGKYTGYVNALHQWLFKFVRVTPQFSIKRPGGTASLQYDSTGIKHTSDIAISAASMASISTLLTLTNFPTATLTVTATKLYKVQETA